MKLQKGSLGELFEQQEKANTLQPVKKGTVLVDTSVWIDFFRQRSHVVKVMVELLEQRKVIAVEVVFGELLQGLMDEEEKQMILNYWHNLPKHLPDNGWIQTGIFSAEKRLFSKGIGLIDAYLICAARWGGHQVWTLDKKLSSQLEQNERFEVNN